MKEQPECIVVVDGTKEWRLHGKWHREDGPAVEWADGGKSWFLNGRLHREDGPAIEYSSGTKEWYLNGEWVHPETIVDLHLSRGVFCYYNEKTQTLHLAKNE
jgi:hypothetical protein